MVIEEHARAEILLPNETDWRFLSEDDIIKDSLSIASKCMDDGSFMLGGVFSAQLSAKLRISGENINSYAVIGAKIKVYSWYGNQNEEQLRGVFWITSAAKINDVYTISASDALIWLDSSSYNDGENGTSEIYNALQAGRILKNILETILDIINKNLNIDEKLIRYKWENENDESDAIVNDWELGTKFCLLSPDMVGEISTRNPRDYISWLSELACGFIFMDYSKSTPSVRIGQFGEEIKNSISYEEVELNSCEIADFTLKFNRVYTKVYNGHTGCSTSVNHVSGITIDVSDNPFKDGYWYNNGGYAVDILENIYKKMSRNDVAFRPFKLKCHCQKYFKLGQKIELPNSQQSTLTSIKWQFRGGYILSCAGRDARILSVAAKRSRAAKVKDLAYTKTNTEKAKILKQLENNKSDLQQQIDNKSNDISELSSKIREIWGVINEMDNNDR